MKQRTNLKMILIFCIMVLAILLIGSTKVEANNTSATGYGVITSGTVTENDIPDTFNVDIKEVEFAKAYDIILDQIIAKLQEKDIQVVKYSYAKDEYGMTIDHSQANGKDYITVQSFDIKKASVSISSKREKQVNIVYNNSNQYNAETKKVVEQKANNLNLPKKDNRYHILKELELGDKTAFGGWWSQYTLEHLIKAFNDSTITVTYGQDAKGDGPDEFEDYMDEPYYIFKDGVYYTTIEANGGYTSKLTVPSNVEDIETYATSRINNYLKEFYKEMYDEDYTGTVTKLEKLSGDNYKIYINEHAGFTIPIRKAESSTDTTPIIKEDKTTGIKIEAQVGSISVNITISSNKVTDQATINKVAEILKNISSKYTVYDISLLENNTKVQPNGKIKVSMPIPNGYDTSKLVVYRITDSGEKVEYKPTVSDNYAVFETDHFSTYVLAETGTVKAPNQDKPNTSTPNSNKLDETPKTGINDIVLVSSAIVSIISLAGIIVIKRK